MNTPPDAPFPAPTETTLEVQNGKLGHVPTDWGTAEPQEPAELDEASSEDGLAR